MPKKDTKLEKLSEKIHITVEEIRNLGVENLVSHLPINYTFLLARIVFYCVVFGQRCHRIASLKRLV